jgi:glycosyltransferase involved in cell wall biosynthesis
MVTSHLVRHLDPARYRAVVASEAGPDVLSHLFDDHVRCYSPRRLFNYTHWDRVRPTLRKLPFRWLRSAANLMMTCVAGLLNTVYYLRLARIVRTERVDLIHHSNGATHFSLAMFGRPYMGTLAGIKSTPYSRFQKMALKRMHRMVMISKVAHDAYVKCGGREEIAIHVPNPCDPKILPSEERAAIRERFGIGKDEKVFGIIGRIVSWKGQKEFARAAVRVLEELPATLAVVAGSAADGGDEYVAAVHAIVDGSQHRDRVRFLGYVPNVHEVYNILDVAVHASTIPEPFGLVIIESMAHGVPIVAADSGGPVEIIEEGVDGFLVDPTKAADLAERITRLLKDRELRKRMGAAGRAKVRQQYDAQGYADRIQGIYDEILAD